MFDPKHSCVVVIGAQWGDEGKGKLVDVLAESADYVVRYQGGANAGHTVVVGERQFVLHQIPSGILHDGAVCMVGNGVVLDPETFFGELDDLAEQGIDISGRLFVSERAHLVMPYHKLLDHASEKTQKIGTTGRGIGPTYEDKIGRRGVRVSDLCRGDHGRALIADRIGRANQLLKMMGSDEVADLGVHIELAERLGKRLRPIAVDTGLKTWHAIKAGKRVLLEGAQGAMLDVDHGTYPFVTSSSTTAGGAAVGVGIGPTDIDGALGVVKAYTTRVGNGPLPTLAGGELEEELRTAGGEFGATTGRPRRCGWFDAAVMKYSVRVNGLTGLAVTKLDVLDSFTEIPIAVGYRLDGKECEGMPADVDDLDRVEPIYETLPGWQSSTAESRSLASLPRAARVYLDRIQDLAQTPIRYVSVGTRRDQIIEV